MSIRSRNIVLEHPDLVIESGFDEKGKQVYTGISQRYEPFRAEASTAIDCFFKFNIQLSEQKRIVSFLKR